MKANYSRSTIWVLLLIASCLFLIISNHITRRRAEQSGICSFSSAVYMVVNQVKYGRIVIFAAEEPTLELKSLSSQQNINIEIVFSKDILENNRPLAGSYNQFNNILLLEYASYEYLNKDKDKGKAVINLIAMCAPRTSVATQGKSISAEKLKLMLKNKNSEAEKILEHCAGQWIQRQKDVESWGVLKME